MGRPKGSKNSNSKAITGSIETGPTSKSARVSMEDLERAANLTLAYCAQIREIRKHVENIKSLS